MLFKKNKGAVKMKKIDKELVFNTEKYEDFKDFVDAIFWDDLYLEELETYYLYDANQNDWYAIEARYHYADILELFKDGKMIRFDEVKDEDVIEELEGIFIG